MKKSILALTTITLLSGCSSLESDKVEEPNPIPSHVVNTSKVFDQYVENINKDFIEAGLDCDYGIPLIKKSSYNVGMVTVKMYQSEVVTIDMAYGKTEKASGSFEYNNLDVTNYVQEATLTSETKIIQNETNYKNKIDNFNKADFKVLFSKKTDDVIVHINMDDKIQMVTSDTTTNMTSISQLDEYTTNGFVTVFKICPIL